LHYCITALLHYCITALLHSKFKDHFIRRGDSKIRPRDKEYISPSITGSGVKKSIIKIHLVTPCQMCFSWGGVIIPVGASKTMNLKKVYIIIIIMGHCGLSAAFYF